MPQKTWTRPVKKESTLVGIGPRKIAPPPIRRIRITEELHRVGAIARWERKVHRVTLTSWVVVASPLVQGDRTPNLYCQVLTADKGLQTARLGDLFLSSEAVPTHTLNKLKAIARQYDLEVSCDENHS